VYYPTSELWIRQKAKMGELSNTLFSISMIAALTVRWLSKPWHTAASKQSQGGKMNVGKHDETYNSSDIDKTTSDSPAPTTDNGGIRIMVCTGERMKSLIEDKLYKAAGVKCTSLEVRHSQGLSNEFQCYSSFENDIIKHI